MTVVQFDPAAKMKEWAALPSDERPNVPVGWKPSRAEPLPVVRCTVIKKDGERCKKWSLRGLSVCVKHGGYLPLPREHAAAVIQAARMRLIDDTDMAVDTLEALMEPGTAEGIRLKAATETLDRAGIRGGFEVDVAVEEVQNPAQMLAERLVLLRERGQRALAASLDPETTISGQVIDPNVSEAQGTLF